jgi:gluconate kinase
VTGGSQTAASFTGWVPIRFYWQAGRPCVDWCRLGDRCFTEPFFDQTIEACLHHPFNLAFRRQAPVETLLDWQAQQPGVPPTGFVFHMSRCGSTLVAQMLAALSHNIVLSEAGPIDEMLNSPKRGHQVSDGERCAWLRAMVSALGQRWRGHETQLFVKFDCWHVADLPLIRTAFPAVPWIFLYRDPAEVLASQMQQPGAQMVPGMLGPALLGIETSAAIEMGREEYAARTLARICAAALDHHRQGGMLVHYRELPQAMWTTLADFFGLSLTAADVDSMRNTARFDAKTPRMFFTDDSAEKKRGATDRIREAADRWVNPVYERLEAARHASRETPELGDAPGFS